jgi:hypothetical protein
MSTAAKLLASPKALSRLRMYCQGRQAYILPTAVGSDEVDLAVALGVPLLGPAAHVSRALGRKSAARCASAWAHAGNPVSEPTASQLVCS